MMYKDFFSSLLNVYLPVIMWMQGADDMRKSLEAKERQLQELEEKLNEREKVSSILYRNCHIVHFCISY